MIDFFGEYRILTIIFIIYTIFSIIYMTVIKDKQFLFGYIILFSIYIGFLYADYLYRTRRYIVDSNCRDTVCETKYSK